MLPLAGKTALVTGGSRGIGRGIAERLARDGATIAVHYGRNSAEAEACVAAIAEAGGRAFPVKADLASLDEISAMFDTIDAEFSQRDEPRLDILVNNAATLTSQYIEDVDPAGFDALVTTNMRGPFFITQHALKRMGTGGRIVFLSSNSVRVAYPEVVVYSMTKAAISNLVLSLAQQLGARGITVNTVVPGIIDTDMNASWFTDDVRAFVGGITALGRIGTVEEIANVVAFLASNESSWVTGQSIEASGGCRI